MSAFDEMDKHDLLSAEIGARGNLPSNTKPVDGVVKRTNILKATLCITVGILVGMIFVHLFSRSWLLTTNNDIFKFSTQFRGTDNVDVDQHVTSVSSKNYVMYHVIKPFETAWIVDDFAMSLQLMKITTPEYSICYVTNLNKTHATPPEHYGSQYSSIDTDSEKQHIQSTFSAEEMELSDLSHLGSMATTLCHNTPTFWIHPVNGTTSTTSQVESHTRSKRNVKKCVTSCCVLVCCCNQHFYQWQSAQKFNCNNVCHGCSSLSKMTTIKMC